MKKFLIVMPTYNEFNSLPVTISKIMSSTDSSVLIVDDNSTDKTGDLADSLSTQHKDRVYVLHRPAKQGLGPAYIAGFRWAFARDYDYIIEMDADGQHRVEDLVRLIDYANKNPEVDLTIGSRKVKDGGTKNWSMLRRFISRGAEFYSFIMLGLKTKDSTSGFRIYKVSTFSIDLDKIVSKGYLFQVEMTYMAEKAKVKIVEVPILFFSRKQDESKMSYQIALEAFYWITRQGVVRFFSNFKRKKHSN
jgi:dolichol-phosphate mannosyltransferase